MFARVYCIDDYNRTILLFCVTEQVNDKDNT